MSLSLEDFKIVNDNLKRGRKQQVTALHKYVFENDGDRRNRQRLRDFQGFKYDESHDRYRQKCEFVDINFNDADLMSICMLLGLSYGHEDRAAHIFRNLRAGCLLQDAVDDDEDETDEAEEDVDEVDETVRARDYEHDVNVLSNGASVGADAAESTSGKRCVEISKQQRFALNFRDIEDSIKPFEGTSSTPVKDWVEEFEENAAMMCWDQLQMLVFAKKSLRGLAKQFVRGEKGLTSWPKLKTSLLKEFKSRVNSRQVHRRLTQRKMNRGESVMEYLYSMKEIAVDGNIEERDLIMYVIDGVNDINMNKQMLYGARSIDEFKEKIRDYEEFTKKPNTRGSEKKPAEYEERNSDEKKVLMTKHKYDNAMIKCYNCGENGHKSATCRNKSKGTKCFQCGKFGHVARDCGERRDVDQQKVVRCLSAGGDAALVKVRIGDRSYTALIDTGSHVNVMKVSIYKQLKLPELSATNMRLSGFGRQSENIVPLGCVGADVEIEEEFYTLAFCVVPDDYMNDGIIIGVPICKQAKLTVNPEGVHVEKLETTKLMVIDVNGENDTVYDIEESASTSAKNIVRSMVSNYEPDKKKESNISMKIILSDETPIACGPRRLPLSERQIVEERIDEWLQTGVIECSESEFCSPIVLVGKKDGTKRLCVDYRRINKVIVRDRFPLPLIDDQLDRLQDAKVFSTLDLKNGFFHVPIEKDSRKFTAFVTHNGQYQFCKVPFGLANSPAVFQRFINAIFREVTQKGIALPYVDDVIVPAKDEDEAVSNLEKVLNLARDYGLNLNFKKCHFLKSRIEFLGHLIEDQKISPSATKVEAMVKYPVPRTLKQLESFLGLAGYFRKFIPQFAKEAQALSDLKKIGTKFVMGPEQMVSFEALKRKLCEKPLLKIFNQCHETELHTDASADGYGAVLLQRSPDDNALHPVYYMSRKTSDAERKYSSYELEILAVIESLKKFRVYLLGTKFKLVTDCNAFAKTMEKKDLSTRVARWLLLLQEYDYVIEHRAGAQMRHVDALSRCNGRECRVGETVMSINEESILEKIARAQSEDEELKAICKVLQQNDSYEDYYLKAKILYKLVNGQELVVVPKRLQFEIIRKVHENGHFGVKKTKELLKNEYYIPNIEDKSKSVIACCIECILVNRKAGRQEGELHPLPKYDVLLHTYHVDHLGPLESTHKMYKHLFVVIDAFTKFCWLYPTKTTTTSEVIAKLRLQSTTFGNPEVIISDRGTAFTSEEFRSYCQAEGVKHHAITTGLPRANGQVERLNEIIIAVLAKLSIEEPNKWYKWVSRVQQVINATYQRSINTTPFELLIGKPMRTPNDVLIKQMMDDEVRTKFDESRNERRRVAKDSISKVQQENKKAYNLRRRPAPKYKLGELVAIKRTQFGGGLKLRAKYLGPYEVTTVKANDTYDVKKVAAGDGPMTTTTCAEYMKRWPVEDPHEARG